MILLRRLIALHCLKQRPSALMSSSAAPIKNEEEGYTVPRVWKSPTGDGMGGTFGSVNLPTSGPRFARELPKGKHPLQLYSMGTPNGQKATILLEELLELGVDGAEYDAWYVNIFEGDQFGSGFVDLNPNSKIPTLLDTTASTTDTEENGAGRGGATMFESGSILLQLSEKFGNKFCPPSRRGEVLNWLFWQMGSAPYLGGGFGHFYSYAPTKMKYPIDRFSMEVKRQLDVLEKQLEKTKKYVAGDDYTLADIAIWPWYGNLALGNLYPNSDIFLNVEEEYPRVVEWAKLVLRRPAVQRGRIVNKKDFLKERHSSSDFDDETVKAKAEAETKKLLEGGRAGTKSKKRGSDQIVADERGVPREPDNIQSK